MKVKAKDIGREHIGLRVKTVDGKGFGVRKVSHTSDRVYLEGWTAYVYFFLDQDVEFVEPTTTVELTQEEVHYLLRLLPDRWQQGDAAGSIRHKLGRYN